MPCDDFTHLRVKHMKCYLELILHRCDLWLHQVIWLFRSYEAVVELSLSLRLPNVLS